MGPKVLIYMVTVITTYITCDKLSLINLAHAGARF